MSVPKYLIVTPVRNEGAHLQRTIDSVVSQQLRPLRWVVVNDGSTDNTGALLDAAAKQHPWIRVLHRADRGFRKQGGGVVEAFYDGFVLAENEPWDFVAKLDGDLSFEPDYFARSLERFDQDKKLGIGGGVIYCDVGGSLIEDSPGDPSFHVRGAVKIYRRKTWDAIDGLIRATGWDTLDEIKANMLGWKTYSFRDLRVVQLKPTGSADGSWKNWVKNGRANYITGYHPVFMFTKCLRRLFQKPLGIGAIGLWWGFMSSYFQNVPQVPQPDVIRYLRREQMNRLLFRKSLWNS